MALKLYNETDIEAIADAIRGKNGSSDTYKVSEMADAIDDIPTGGGSSLPASCKFYARITPTSDTYMPGGRLYIDTGQHINNYGYMILAVEPTATPETGYSALGQGRVYFLSLEGTGAILRANGTQGSDGGMSSYDPTTGQLGLGGQFGTFRAGKSYDVYLFEHGGVAS